MAASSLPTPPLPFKTPPLPVPALLRPSTPRRLRPSPPLYVPFPRFGVAAPAPTPIRPPQPPPPPDELASVGDGLVFEEDAFEDPISAPTRSRPARRRSSSPAARSLIPEKWREAAEELRIDKKERRRILRELNFGRKVQRRSILEPPAVLESPEYLAFREAKLSQMHPVVLDNPRKLPEAPPQTEVVLQTAEVSQAEAPEAASEPAGRVAPKNPRDEVGPAGLESIRKFFTSGEHAPVQEGGNHNKPRVSRNLFTQEERNLINRKVPSLAAATSNKWLPLHSIAASGEFYLMDALLKHNVNINAVDSEGLGAIHKAIIGKKHAILNYLLRESANPFVRDNGGATLMHYAVQTASSHAIKILLLYNVDINLPDDDGWTPLHLAVQSRRTDIVRLLLIKGADGTLRNKDGLTPLELCLHSGKSERTYELIKLFKRRRSVR